jgi:dipeptidyl aminopeptidase/acylaminoacyl peptidase
MRSIGVIALMSSALLAQASAAPPESRADGSGLFAYEALTVGVFTIRPDGTDYREILPGAQMPEWSRDGSRLLYSRFGGLWSSLPDGTDPRQIVVTDPGRFQSGPCNAEFEARHGAWSPSGRQIAFEAVSEDVEERQVSEICTVRHDGSLLRRLRRGSEPNWIPNGRRIVFIASTRPRQGLSNSIATMRRDGSRVRVLLGRTKGYRYGLDVSPDGRKLAFLEGRLGPGFQPTEIRIMSLRTGRTRTIPWSTTGLPQAVEWTPDGTRLAFSVRALAVGRTPPSPVYTIRPDGSELTHLFTLPAAEQGGPSAVAVSWQPQP